jgi:hypothetical protein
MISADGFFLHDEADAEIEDFVRCENHVPYAPCFDRKETERVLLTLPKILMFPVPVSLP